jgi:hypothetical protein
MDVWANVDRNLERLQAADRFDGELLDLRHSLRMSSAVRTPSFSIRCSTMKICTASISIFTAAPYPHAMASILNPRHSVPRVKRESDIRRSHGDTQRLPLLKARV